MSREVQQIPPAPRHDARWGAALWYRWPLALGGFVFAVYGGLVTLMLFFASEGKARDDARLDSRGARTDAVVTEVQSTLARVEETPYELIAYRFEFDGLDQHGSSLAPAGLAQASGSIEIEFLPEALHVNRVAGGRINLLGNYVTPAFWITVAPGLALIILWLWGAVRTHRVLVHGDVAIARITSMRVCRFVVPTMLAVEFTFRDRNAVQRSGRHWVRERSHAGERLSRNPEFTTIVHDRARPDRHRLVSVDDFASTAA